MKKIVFLPLDERPCNRFAERMSEGNGEFRLVLPPREAMGDKKIPSDCEALAAFLVAECRDADALVISLDQLLYGGIVPSRLHRLGRETVARRLAHIPELVRENNHLRIYAYQLVMRCPSYSSSDEEPDYYERCGREIFLTGRLEHERLIEAVTEEEYRRRRAELDRVTGADLDDFLLRRRKNLDMVLEAARMSRLFDLFVVPQDDSAPLGYTALDRERLFCEVSKMGVPQPLNYPGADEVGSVLLARAVNDMKGVRPSVRVKYACEAGKGTVPLYEDRPLAETVLSQIKAAGCVPARGEADITLFVNVTEGGMKDIGERTATHPRSVAMADEIAAEIERGGVAAVADVAYCNGGDAGFVRAIADRTSLFRLASYAGWNTSSNSLGTAIAQAVMCLHYGRNEAHDLFLAERFYEDVGYCGYVRGHVCETVLPALGLDYFHADGREGMAAAAVKKELEAYIGELLPEVAREYELERCTLPWRRMFEAEIRVKKREEKEEV